MNEQYWKQKLMAFLHDPPCKALDFTKTHEEIAMGFVKAALPSEDYQAWYGWLKGLSDSDWFAAEADRISGFGRGAHVTTFGNGSSFNHPLGGAEYTFRSVPTKQKAEEILQSVQKGIQVDSSASPDEQSRQNFFFHWRRWMEESVQCAGGHELALFPADTRIPDHTIWNHMNLASAFQGCRDEAKNIRVSFLTFQIGPVQEFIAQARSTRDLWCGSYLLSWLTGTAIKAITDELGPDHLIFPALRAQGVFDALHQELYSSIKYGAEKETLWKRLYKDGSFDERVASAQRLLSPTLPNRFFALVPQGREAEFAQKANDAIAVEMNRISEVCWTRFCELVQMENSSQLTDMKKRWDRQVDLFVQTSWAATKLDEIKHWQKTYSELTEQMAARRNTRNFVQFVTDEHQRLSPKDVLSGKEEIIGSKELWNDVLKKTKEFKEEGPYGALSIIKRLWCHSKTANGLLGRLDIEEPVFIKALRMESMQTIACLNVERSKEKDDDGEPLPVNPYVAVIAFDGDQIGKRLSGELMPMVIEQVANGLAEYVVDEPRKLTPSFHTQFSESLANFATHLARRVVQHHKGLMVYAGGDDVLAIVPADQALDCAADLRALFVGDKASLSQPESHYEFGIVQNGFVAADKGHPLIVPGPNADASCGIAVGHYKHPLQALVREAQKAEKRAKTRYAKVDGEYKSGAFSLSLIKRSGEIVEWGARWNQQALSLYRDFTQKSKEEKLSGRFAYALAELLKPYRLDENPQQEMRPIIEKEFAHVLIQQSPVKGTELEKATDYLYELPDERLEDFSTLFLASTFMNRPRGEN
jgi:CRISPR-associated protein Cmr2